MTRTRFITLIYARSAVQSTRSVLISLDITSILNDCLLDYGHF
jgi:hypothetical protein